MASLGRLALFAAQRARAPQKQNPCRSKTYRGQPGVCGLCISVDFEAAADSADWTLAHLNFMRRHLIAHRSGVVDKQCLDKTGEPSSLLGRRLVVNPAQVAGLADAVERLGITLIKVVPSP